MNPTFPHLIPGLTIAIPTYNRPVDLAKTLDVIIPQVLENENVYLVIYDNASPQSLPSFSDPRIAGHPRVKLVRNRYNEGIANFMNCFVNCETEWIWVLGDDDLPSKNAVDLIFSKMAPDYAYITFRIPTAKTLLQINEDISGEGLPDLFDLFEHGFLRLLFLSGSVYQMRFMREHISAGYLHLYSGAPHTFMLFRAIENGAKWLCSTDCIADYQKPEESQHWNRFIIFYGIPTIIPALRLESSRQLVRDSLPAALAMTPKRFLRHMQDFYQEQQGDLARIFSTVRSYYAPDLRRNFPEAWAWWKLQLRLSLGFKPPSRKSKQQQN